MTKAITTIERAEKVLIEWIKETDMDNFRHIFEYVFGVRTSGDSEEFVIEPGQEADYGGIIEDEFKEDIVKDEELPTL